MKETVVRSLKEGSELRLKMAETMSAEIVSAATAIAEEAVRIGDRFFWMQEGVVSDRAREILEAAGIPCVMDRCVKKELAKRGK